MSVYVYFLNTRRHRRSSCSHASLKTTVHVRTSSLSTRRAEPILLSRFIKFVFTNEAAQTKLAANWVFAKETTDNCLEGFWFTLSANKEKNERDEL